MWWFTLNRQTKEYYNTTTRKRLGLNLSNNNHNALVLGILFLVLVICSALEDSAQKECEKSQYKCLCGVPQCIDKSLVKNGVQDCLDGSDEGQWDPSKCAIKNNTSENIRFKRAALSELKRVVNGGATTTYFEDGRGSGAQTRPIGLLTTTMGSFVTSGTTTEYITKLLATYIKNTYARIKTTSSRIYHAVPTELPNGESMMIRPTGFIASTISTQINGYATTAITTDFYRTYIDGTYAQVVSSYSNVYYPPWYTDPIVATKEPIAHSSAAEDGLIYATPVIPTEESFRTTVQVVNNGRLETIVIAQIMPTKASSFPKATPIYLPQELSGNFITKKSSNGDSADIIAELGIVETANENRLRALRPNNIKENEVRVTGTHGNFVHTNSAGGDETTYNVFTGTYVQNSKTFLFFFGNTVLQPSLTGSLPQQTIIVENGPQKNNVIVDMSQNLKVIVPAAKNRATVDSSINGEVMEGVMVEIESSESDIPYDSEHFISVDGATKQTPAINPVVDEITLTLDKNNVATPTRKTKSFSTSSSSSSKPKDQNDNEIPTGRKAPAGIQKPTPVQSVSLPTFTVGQYENSFGQDDDLTLAPVAAYQNTETSSARSSSSSSSKKMVPVFQRPASQTKTSTYNTNSRSQKGQPGSFRVPKSNTGRSANGRISLESSNEVDNVNEPYDLQSAASTGRATVTYVGFADFTTTVGNTVIVFMPRTKMIEDLTVHASKTVPISSASISPTPIFSSETVTTRITSSTTEKLPAIDEDDDIRPFVTTVQPKKVVEEEEKKESSSVSIPRGRKKDFAPKYLGSTTFSPSLTSAPPSVDIEPSTASETTIVFSGRQTLFTNIDLHNSRILEQQSGVQTRIVEPNQSSINPPTVVEPTPVPTVSSVSQSPSEKRSSLFPPRPKFTPKSKVEVSSPAPSPVFSPSALTIASSLTSPVVSSTPSSEVKATTAVFQTDQVNPTGLVTSIGGSIVRDSTTTLFTSLIFGTFIGTSYAQIIKSTSTVFFLIPSKTVDSELASSSLFSPVAPVVSSIQPTRAASFSPSSSAVSSAFSYEVTTSSSSESTSDETTTQPSTGGDVFDRAEVSVTTTESVSGNNLESSGVETTTTQNNLDDSEALKQSTTPKDENLEAQNEIEGRKVGGTRPKDQLLASEEEEKPTPSTPAEEDQTIFVTRTLPTTVYRTYTYYTTFFIPKDAEETVTSVISREITSTAVGFVKKTFSSVLPTSSASIAPSRESTTLPTDDESPEDEIITPTSAQVIYKTFFTTYTYVTTFFTGQTTSLASREEIVSNVVTTTQGVPEEEPSSSPETSSTTITPTSSVPLVEPTKTKTYASPSRSRSSSSSSSSSIENKESESRGGKSSVVKKYKSSSVLPRSPLFESSVSNSPSSTSSLEAVEELEKSSTVIPSVVELTIQKTFYTSLTYFTTLFNGIDASTKTRTEVITNIVPTTTRSTIYNTIVPTSSSTSGIVESTTASSLPEEEPQKHQVGETTFYTTYTYLSSIFKDGSTILKSSLDTYTNVVAAGSTIRSGLVKKTASTVEPTKVEGRTAASKKVNDNDDVVDSDDLNEVGSHLSELSETTLNSVLDEPEVTTLQAHIELEGSEVTTERSIYNEHEHFDEHDKNGDDGEDENEISATPALRTYYTTFTFFTTFYKHGTSMVSSRLETVTNIASETVHDHEGASSTDSPNQQILPVYPITYFTTYTYWTTSFKDKTPVVTSREETVSNVVTPGVDDIVSSKTVSASESVIEPTLTLTAREGKQNEITDVEPSEIFAEIELTTYFTTYTYYTTSYLGDETIVNSRFETVTNLVTGVIEPTQIADSSLTVTAALSSADQTPRAIGSAPTEQLLVVENTTPALDEHDYDLPVGLLSTVVNTEVTGATTTVFSTDVFGTYIDGIYAQVLESTSKIVLAPTKVSTSIYEGMETNYMDEASSKPNGLLSSNAGKIREGENNNTVIFYTTQTFGTIIGNKYAHVTKTVSTVQVDLDLTDSSSNAFKTGLVRVIDGSVVENEKTTTFYTTSVLGQIIENQYAQILESTSRVIINPTKSEEFTTIQPTSAVDIESSEEIVTTEEIPTTTPEENVEEHASSDSAPSSASSNRFLGRGRDRSSRVSFNSPGSSKSLSPFITPFSSRSRAAFAPKRKQTAGAVIVTRTDVTPTVTATLAPASTSSSRPSASRGSNFVNRNNRNRGREEVTASTPSSTSAVPTPRLPSTAGRTRFQRPKPGGAASLTESTSEAIQPTSIKGTTSSSPGARGRGSSFRASSAGGFSRRGSSTLPGSRGSASFSAGSVSSAGFRGTGASSSKFNARGRGNVNPTKSASTVKPTAVPEDDEYEVIEYEYDNNAPNVGSSTTEKTTTALNRFGNNRFRLNPRLQTANLVTTAGTTTTTQRSTGNLPFLKKRTFTRPPPASATSTTESEAAAVVDGVEQILESGLPAEQPSSTVKPRLALKNLIKPVSRTTNSGSARPPTTTTSTTPAPRTTTRRAFAPRSRPQGFPSKALVRPTAGTSSTTAAEPDTHDDEIELEESKSISGVLTSEPLLAAGSEIKPVVAPLPSSDSRIQDLQSDASIQVGSVGKEKTFEGDIVNVPYLVDSGSQFFDDVASSPYESYEYYNSDDNSNISNSNFNETESSDDDLGRLGHRRGQILKRSVRQVLADYNYDDHDYYYGQRKRSTLRSKFRPSSYNTRNTNSRPVSSLNSDYDEYYYDESPAPPPPPPTTTTTTPPPTLPRNRFRGRISPTTSTSRQTPFTLTNPNTRTSSFTQNTGRSSSGSTPSFTRRAQSRYVRPASENVATTTTQRPNSSSSRFRSRYRGNSESTTTARSITRNRYSSPVRGRGSSSSSLSSTNIRGGSYNNEDRYTTVDESRAKEPVELGTISVTHYLPAETTIPVINGKVTEYKTILTPSASVEIVSPFQYSFSDYQGKSVLVLTSELSSTPTFGVTEVTKYLIRETSTTSVTFTPTTIRGRKTSFSHIVPSTVYSVEPIVSTITTNPLTDSNQLTNLLLNQLLGNLNLNQNGLLNNLQQQQQQQAQFQQNMQQLAMGEPPTPITQFNTKTTSYVTTVTDFTSTVLPITLHGKAIKTTIIESSTNVITATEFITESTVITPTAPAFVPQQTQLTLPQLQPNQLNGINPALLQGLFQQQQALVLKQAALIAPTSAAQLLVNTQTQVNTEEEMAESRSVKKEELKVEEEEKPKYSIVTLYVSGRNPGEFSTVLSTVPFETNKVKRSIASAGSSRGLHEGEFTKARVAIKVVPTDTFTEEKVPLDYNIEEEDVEDPDRFRHYLEDSYSYSDTLGSSLVGHNSHTTSLNNDQLLQATQSLESVLKSS